MYSNKFVAAMFAGLLMLNCPGEKVWASVELAYETSPESGEWRLSWDDNVTVDATQEGRDWVLRFDRSLGEIDFAPLQKAFPGWIDSIRYGYDSLLLRFSPNVVPQVLVRKQGVSVRMHLRQQDVAYCSQDQLSAAARLRYLSALAQLEVGHVKKARRELQSLREKCPDNGELEGALGRLEERAGRWFLALDHYEKARQAGYTQLAHAEARLRRTHDAHLDARALRSVDDRKTGRLSGTVGFRQRIADDQRVAVAVSQHNLRAPEVLEHGFRSDNQITEGRVALETVTSERSVQTLALSLLPESVGGGFRHQHFADDALSELSIEFNMLDTTDIERMTQEARRDVIALEQTRYRKQALSLSYGLDAVRYHGLGDEHYWAGGYAATVDYLLMQKPVDVFAKYALDAENVRHKGQNAPAGEDVFAPEDFENHSLAGVVSAPWLDESRATLELGYTWDRLGGEGPYQAIQTRGTLGEVAEYMLSVRHGRRENSASEDDVTQVEGNVQVPF